MSNSRTLILVIAFTAVVVPGLAQAMDVFVAPGGDDLLNDCLSAGLPCATIQAAINKAVAPATVHAAAGTYVENLTVNKDLVIDGAGAGSTVIDGNSLASVVTIDMASTVTLSNLTVTHGLAADGGGIRNLGALTLVDCEITDNSAAPVGDGGGIHSSAASSLTLTRVDVTDNDARGGGGLLAEGSTLIEDSLFTGNAGVFGGAIEIDAITATIRTTVFENNFASSRGSAVDNSGNLTIEDCIVRNNTGDGEGGTLYTDGPLLLNRTLVANNAAEDCAGLKVEFDSTVVLNSTLTGNTALIEGGAICNQDDLSILNSTIARNSAAIGGGILADRFTTIRNSIVAENTAATGPDCAGELISDGHNLIGDDTDCGIIGDLTGNLVNVAPGLATLQNNGGPTETLALFKDSPAIDGGDPLGCIDQVGAPLVVDQRGEPRPLAGGCDIGAFEGFVCQAEICDSFDNDCDGSVDEGFDLDGDGVTSCGGDCDDNDMSISPNSPELCDGLDNDCDGSIDEDFDGDGDGVSTCGGDCDDGDAANFPGNAEICDFQDNDCDAVVDEGSDGDGDGVTTCAGDCDDGDAMNYPGNAEVCDLQDNDCDGIADNGFDVDGDGVSSCGGDCDDGDANRFPGNPEVCDGLDNDCNGLLDAAGEDDLDGDGVVACLDNCPADANAGQLDGDGDGVGDACDACPADDGNGLGVNPDGCSGIDSYVCVEVSDLLSLADQLQAAGLDDAQRKLLEALAKLHEGKLREAFKKMKDAIKEIEGTAEPAASMWMQIIADEARLFLEGLLILAQADPNFDQGDFDEAVAKYYDGLAKLVPPADYEEAVKKFEESADKLGHFLDVTDPCELTEATATIATGFQTELEDALDDLTGVIDSPAPTCALTKLEEARGKVLDALGKIEEGLVSGDFNKYKEAVGKIEDAIDRLDDVDPACFDTTALQLQLTDAAREAVCAWLDLALDRFGAGNERVIKATAKKAEGDIARDAAMYKDAVKKYEDAAGELNDLF